MSKINSMGLFNMEINLWWWPSFSFCFFLTIVFHWQCIGSESFVHTKQRPPCSYVCQVRKTKCSSLFFHFQLSHFHCNQNYHCYHRNHSLSPFSSSSSSPSSSFMKLYKFVDQLKIELLLCHAGHLTPRTSCQTFTKQFQSPKSITEPVINTSYIPPSPSIFAHQLPPPPRPPLWRWLTCCSIAFHCKQQPKTEKRRMKPITNSFTDFRCHLSRQVQMCLLFKWCTLESRVQCATFSPHTENSLTYVCTSANIIRLTHTRHTCLTHQNLCIGFWDIHRSSSGTFIL